MHRKEYKLNEREYFEKQYNDLQNTSVTIVLLLKLL